MLFLDFSLRVNLSVTFPFEVTFYPLSQHFYKTLGLYLCLSSLIFSPIGFMPNFLYRALQLNQTGCLLVLI